MHKETVAAILAMAAVANGVTIINGNTSGNCPGSGTFFNVNGVDYCCPGELVYNNNVDNSYCCVGGGTDISYAPCFPFCSDSANGVSSSSSACLTTIPLTASNYAALASSAAVLTSTASAARVSATTTAQGPQGTSSARSTSQTSSQASKTSSTSAQSAATGSSAAAASTSTSGASQMMENSVVVLAGAAVAAVGMIL